jgi:hypothetical protein
MQVFFGNLKCAVIHMLTGRQKKEAPFKVKNHPATEFKRRTKTSRLSITCEKKSMTTLSLSLAFEYYYRVKSILEVAARRPGDCSRPIKSELFPLRYRSSTLAESSCAVSSSGRPVVVPADPAVFLDPVTGSCCSAAKRTSRYC